MVAGVAGVLGVALVALLALPIVGLAFEVTPGQLREGAGHPMFWPALRLSLTTSLSSLVIVVLAGTPVAWWLARSRARPRLVAAVEIAIALPIVVPPAAVGIALLGVLGHQSWLGGLLEAAGGRLAFSTAAVVVAQVVVASPFFIQSSANAFRRVDESLVEVARTLGASPMAAIWRVELPAALPGLLVGASLAWARALGEFGATLLFAGNQRGVAQTLPLAIYAATQTDLRVAVVFALILAALGSLALLGLRLLPRLFSARGDRSVQS